MPGRKKIAICKAWNPWNMRPAPTSHSRESNIIFSYQGVHFELHFNFSKLGALIGCTNAYVCHLVARISIGSLIFLENSQYLLRKIQFKPQV